eukprot:COSAG06_NODE_52110_length_307_cov_6.990385_1_plen_68_part_01
MQAYLIGKAEEDQQYTVRYPEGRIREEHRDPTTRCVRLSQMQPDATPRGAITGLPLENQGGVLGRSI